MVVNPHTGGTGTRTHAHTHTNQERVYGSSEERSATPEVGTKRVDASLSSISPLAQPVFFQSIIITVGNPTDASSQDRARSSLRRSHTWLSDEAEGVRLPRCHWHVALWDGVDQHWLTLGDVTWDIFVLAHHPSHIKQ